MSSKKNLTTTDVDVSEVMEKIGLWGWESQEPIVLCALIADLPIMLYGNHGQAKTKGARAIAKSLLGPDSVFKPYDYSEVSKEEVIGYLNPAGLVKGKLEYIESDSSVWGADAVLFDEFSRANVLMGSMVHELLIDKTIMGMKTKVKISLAAANPPSEYATNYMDLATASRFVMVDVPSANDLTAQNLEKAILGSDNFDSPPTVLKDIRSSATKVVFDAKATSDLVKAVRVLSAELNKFSITFSTRQSKYLFKMIKAAESLKALGYNITEDDLVHITLSLVPEITGLVATSNQDTYDVVAARIKQEWIGIQIGDPVLSGASIEEVLKGDGWKDDFLGWAGAVTLLAQNSEDIDDLVAGVEQMKALHADCPTFKDRPDVFNAMMHEIFTALLLLVKPENLAPEARDMPLTVKTLKRIVRDGSLIVGTAKK